MSASSAPAIAPAAASARGGLRRVAITGMGTINALGHDVPATLAAFREGRCGIGPLDFRDVDRLAIKIGGQDVFWQESGAFTGQISAAMLADAGADYCIVGHSETRGRFGKLETPESTVPYFAETDETVNLKIKRLLFHAITPILCVGETLAEREAEQTEAVIEKQLVAALEGVDPSELASFVVAYEPVWAIGTGKTCASDEANRVCGFIRDVLAKTVEPEVVEHIRVLYGGSVKGANSYELFSQPFIDGGLVGGASLDPGEFSRIVSNA